MNLLELSLCFIFSWVHYIFIIELWFWSKRLWDKGLGDHIHCETSLFGPQKICREDEIIIHYQQDDTEHETLNSKFLL